jgi:hypothetical protein
VAEEADLVLPILEICLERMELAVAVLRKVEVAEQIPQ